MHNGKERVYLARARNLKPEDFPIGTEVTIAYLPGLLFYEVRIEDDKLQEYSVAKAIYIMLALGILLLIIAGCCVIL